MEDPIIHNPEPAEGTTSKNRALRFGVALLAGTVVFDVGQHYGCECRMHDDLLTGAAIPLVVGGWIWLLAFLTRRQAFRSPAVVALAVAMTIVVVVTVVALGFFLLLSHACS